MIDLVVKTPFGTYAAGDRIEDRELVKAILSDERETNVVKVTRAPAEKAKAPAKAD